MCHEKIFCIAGRYIAGLVALLSGIFQNLVALVSDSATLESVFRSNWPLRRSEAALNNDFTVRPWLAESWERSADGLLTIKLKKGVKFHDGSNFDAASLKNTMGFWEKKTNYKSVINFSTVKMIDRYTLQFRSKDPKFAQVMGSLALYQYGVLQVANNPDLNPIGTGPGNKRLLRKGISKRTAQFK